MYHLEGQVESVKYSLVDGNTTLKVFGSPYEFIVINGLPKVELADVVRCEVARLGGHQFQVHRLNVADKVVYKSAAFLADSSELICSTNDDSIAFRNVLSEVRDIELELIKFLKRHPDKLFDLHPEAFEKLIAEIFAANGYDAQWTGRCRDTAADVLAIRRTASLEMNECYLIECKRYARQRSVGVDVARALYGAVINENCTGGVLVTTSRFESGVHEFASSKWNFHAKDYDDLTKWLGNYLPKKNGRLYMGASVGE